MRFSRRTTGRFIYEPPKGFDWLINDKMRVEKIKKIKDGYQLTGLDKNHKIIKVIIDFPVNYNQIIYLEKRFKFI